MTDKEIFALKVFKLVGKYPNTVDELLWDEDLNICIGCNDVFWWATADAEPIETEEDYQLLKVTLEECQKMHFCAGIYSDILYASRKRKMRPQGAIYKSIYGDMWPLFDACGPERSVGKNGNTPKPDEPKHWFPKRKSK